LFFTPFFEDFSAAQPFLLRQVNNFWTYGFICGWPKPVSSRSAKQPGWRSPPIVIISRSFLHAWDSVQTEGLSLLTLDRKTSRCLGFQSFLFCTMVSSLHSMVCYYAYFVVTVIWTQMCCQQELVCY
jgi:hypothetical protein